MEGKVGKMKTSDRKPEKRSLAFWAWNDLLDGKELKTQVSLLKKGGYAGYFMHSREGLESVYLSDEWLKLCKDCAEDGYSKGMLPFLYDEDKWPSGMAGGLVSKLHPDCAAKAYVYDKRTGRIGIRTSKGNPWYNGFAPANNLSEKSVRSFLEITHQRYADAFGGSLSGMIEGFFTDEPNFWDFFFTQEGKPLPALPYTDDLPREFRKRRGYDLEPRLLFLKDQGYQKHRHDYWRTLSELFCERYTQQLYRWCSSQGVRLCGHLLFENDLGYQVRVCGAVMPNYKYMHVPGIDILGEQTREYLTVKQCTSVAHQYGKKSVITETYGCTGWDFTFEGQKRLWDFQCALGVTIRAPHLSFYSIRGLRKRDFPPAFSYQSEWFRYNRVISDYCDRLSSVMTEGEPIRDVLVIHPISGFWCESGSSPDEDLSKVDDMGFLDPALIQLNARGDELNRFAEMLLKNGIDFDFGDEQLMAEDASVQNAEFRIGRASYKIVVLPETESIFQSTRDLLKKFVRNGGILIATGSLPHLTEGVRIREEEADFSGAIRTESYEETVQAVRRLLPVPAEVQDLHTGNPAGVISVFRKCGDGISMIVVNEVIRRECRIVLHGADCAEEVDLQTGKEKKIPVGDSHVFYEDFIRSDCRVFRLKKGKCSGRNQKEPYHHPHETEKIAAALPPEAEFSRTMPNSLTLDFCRYAFDGENLSEPMQIWQAQRKIRERLGMRQIVGNGVEMRYRWIGEKKPSADITLNYLFMIRDLPEGPVSACIENAERFEVICNGGLCPRPSGWFVDKAIQKVKLKNLRPGINTLELKCHYTNEMELEDIYLIGNFGVNLQREIVSEPKRLHMGDITQQGYFHYAGSMIYRFRFQSDCRKAELVLGDYRAALIVVRVNRKTAGTIMAGNRLEIQLRIGENNLEIEAVGSNRNLMGPFHHTYDGCSRIGWKDFRMEEGEDYTPEYIVKPYGLMSQIKIIRLDD